MNDRQLKEGHEKIDLNKTATDCHPGGRRFSSIKPFEKIFTLNQTSVKLCKKLLYAGVAKFRNALFH
jgi:hypothetical protein